MFQRVGPIEAKDWDLAKAVLLCGTKRSSLFKEWSGRLELNEDEVLHQPGNSEQDPAEPEP